MGKIDRNIKRLIKKSNLQEFKEDFEISDTNICILDYLQFDAFDDKHPRINVNDSALNTAISNISIRFSKENLNTVASKIENEIKKIVGTDDIIFWKEDGFIRIELKTFPKCIDKKDITNRYDKNSLIVTFSFNILINGSNIISIPELEEIGF
jgi:hypothetical protein